MHIDDNAASLLADLLHGRFELRAAFATQRAQRVAGKTLRVDTDQRGLRSNLPHRHRQMRLAVDDVLVHREFPVSVSVGDTDRHDLPDEHFGFHPVGDQVFDRYERTVEFLRDLFEFGEARHASVIVLDFADDTHGLEPGEPDQVDASFGLARAHEHAAAARGDGKDMPGPREVRRMRVGVYEDADRLASIAGRDPRRRVMLGVDRNGEIGAVQRGVLGIRHHGGEIELGHALLGGADADQPSPFLSQKIDLLRRDVLGGKDEIALVFPLLVIEKNDNSPRAKSLDGLGDRRNFPLHLTPPAPSRSLWTRDDTPSLIYRKRTSNWNDEVNGGVNSSSWRVRIFRRPERRVRVALPCRALIWPGS